MNSTGTITYENRHTGEEHTLGVELELESGTDSEAWGSTYVPRPWRSIVGEQWLIDGRPMARWCRDWYLHFHGYWSHQRDELMERARDKALENVG